MDKKRSNNFSSEEIEVLIAEVIARDHQTYFWVSHKPDKDNVWARVVSNKITQKSKIAKI